VMQRHMTFKTETGTSAVFLHFDGFPHSALS